MTGLRLTLLSSPVPQPCRELRLEDGAAVLGRESDCDWRLEDPEMFISRHHCRIEAGALGWQVTDTSSGGLYLDMAAQPLGPGASAALRHGMRLRLGDVVLGVELVDAAPPPPPGPADAGLGIDPFFAPQDPAPPPAPRPADLPEPFERSSGRMAAPVPVAPPPGFDDPFTLDPAPAVPAARKPLPQADDWNWGPAAAPPPEPPLPPRPTTFAASSEPAPPALPGGDAAAFLRGAGLDPATLAAPDLEALGRRYRLLAEGLAALLQSRAEEKGALRLAQTTLGAAAVNPLKFLAMPEERLAALVAARGPGYLDPDAAILEALRDLADHQMRSWQGLQAALRRMIDHFAPEAIAAELAPTGTLRALAAGGRSALLWQAYERRWSEIARAAEDRFLGEIGADFREAYETSDRRET
ncbi:type VI secretion system-associated FHA domain protein TagH [Paracoccus sp. (in: a-proteobacteria)]|uniref:type VI secretion system-associated FHA domain protein TagH n=1 Tax=Paracoccus sp. TaxID=267 RepID=UPI00321FF584